MQGTIHLTTAKARGLGVALAAVVVLALALVAAKPAAADTCNPLGDTFCPQLFTPLRGSITTHVPGGPLRRGFLAQVDLAQTLVDRGGTSTIPTIPLRAARLIIWSLGVQARFLAFVGVLSNAGATAVSTEVDAVLATLLPPSPI